jgi:PrcB C-terminal
LKTLVLLALAAIGAARAVPQTADAVTTIDKGDQSNIDLAKQVVLRTDAEWNALWTTHGGDRKKPAVDFSRDMVVGVFMGSRPSAGYTISIVSTFQKDGQMLVRYEEKAPAKGTLAAQILTAPYHLVALPKMAGTVKFEKIP